MSNMRSLSLPELKPGMRVVFVDETYNVHVVSRVDAPVMSFTKALSGKELLVISVEPHNPGKQVGIYSKIKMPFGNSLDGRVPHGHGLYVLPEQLYTVEMYEEHKKAFDIASTRQIEIDEMLKAYAHDDA